ncbi:hypothetical protein PSTG_07262 [Puccinia striiformis f. sp. tritici PST-78]|uniref:Uncharacterized protein n=1 Tax=Puccinia striiformis f. sp. tritici PST-78 TaxID=1165861 RepID=A0A0L0VJV3_9BASI|nr:hypothetical protein PSTG_07262 [Puccinia striiformis f. sp. tritici PST-78]
MSSLINFKAIQGIIVVGPLAELNNEQIIQCFTPDVVQLMIDHLPENFCPSEGCPKLVVENDPETCHALYIKDNGLSLTQGEHDAFIKKLVSFFGCEMPLPDGLVISARVRLVFTCGDRAWIKFSAHEGPNGLMVAEDQSSKFYMNFWSCCDSP